MIILQADEWDGSGSWTTQYRPSTQYNYSALGFGHVPQALHIIWYRDVTKSSIFLLPNQTFIMRKNFYLKVCRPHFPLQI